MTLDELTKAIAGARERDKFAYEVISEADRGYACEDVHMLLAVIDQLLPDARRLDWILSDHARGQAIRVQGSELRGWSVIDMSDGVRILSRAPTPREAIDRAIEGEKK